MDSCFPLLVTVVDVTVVEVATDTLVWSILERISWRFSGMMSMRRGSRSMWFISPGKR